MWYPKCESDCLVAAFALFATLLTALPGAAATIRHDVPDQLYLNHAAEPQFAAAGYETHFGSVAGSWVLINPHWALTAAHIVDRNNNGLAEDEPLASHTFVLGSESRTPSHFEVPWQYDGNVNNGYDLGLAYFNQPFFLTQPAAIYTGRNELDQPVSTVGFGNTGTGKTGAFQQDDRKRAWDNRIDFYARFPGGGTFNASRIENTDRTGLFWDFDEPAPRTSPDYNPFNNVPPAPLRDLEGNGAPGDSGGPSFLFDNGQWWLIGINSAEVNNYTYPNAADPQKRATYGDGLLVTRVSSYAAWITSILESYYPSDFNFDGSVDAADYVQWRKYNGQPEDFRIWRSHFGESGGSGADIAMNVAVPEPTTLLLLAIAATNLSSRRPPRASTSHNLIDLDTAQLSRLRRVE